MDLGRLKPVAVRQVWPHEAADFTPWLLTNDDVLAEALGIEVQLTAAEHRVGGFGLDLLGHDLTHDAVLIVENQLEGTDHSHLGQLLTYAAGTDAATIVWIATQFRDEHRQALDWLNQHTGEDVRFFGVELTAVRIGGSAAAPLLRLVAEPNDWQKTTKAAARSTQSTSARAELYREYWAAYLARVHADQPTWTSARKPQTANWMSQPSPLPCSIISVSFAQGRRLRHELYLDSSTDDDLVGIWFDHLVAHRDVLDATYGAQLSYEELPDRRASRIADYREDASVDDVDRHDEFIDWHVDAGVRLRAALAAVPPLPTS